MTTTPNSQAYNGRTYEQALQERNDWLTKLAEAVKAKVIELGFKKLDRRGRAPSDFGAALKPKHASTWLSIIGARSVLENQLEIYARLYFLGILDANPTKIPPRPSRNPKGGFSLRPVAWDEERLNRYLAEHKEELEELRSVVGQPTQRAAGRTGGTRRSRQRRVHITATELVSDQVHRVLAEPPTAAAPTITQPRVGLLEELGALVTNLSAEWGRNFGRELGAAFSAEALKTLQHLHVPVAAIEPNSSHQEVASSGSVQSMLDGLNRVLETLMGGTPEMRDQFIKQYAEGVRQAYSKLAILTLDPDQREDSLKETRRWKPK